jgi:aspartate-semialdehyde dehydrogenase
MSKKINVAVVGATGAVGEMMLEILAQRQFPVNEVYALASENSVGKEVNFARKLLEVEALNSFDFSKVQLALFAAGGEVAKAYAPKAADAGCLVIDNSSAFRYEPDVPLIVPEVNPQMIEDFRARNIIANPNCSTIQMVVALKPIYDAVGVKRVTVSTYQSVSGSGNKGITALVDETSLLLNGQSIKDLYYPKPIAFNIIPQVDVFQENGSTREEMKMIWETQKILDNPDIRLNPTAVRVPVFYGHSEAINIETQQALPLEQAKDLLKQAPGIILMDDHEYPTAMTDASGEDAVFVGRVREDLSLPEGYGLNLWVVSDNIRKGAALNAVQIAELWIDRN